MQLLRCFPRWTRALEHLTFRALERLAANEPVDPNDPDVWRSRDAHAQSVLHRHGKGAQRDPPDFGGDHGADRRAGAADRDAGLDWSTVTVPASALDERLARAHARLPVDLEDPRSGRTSSISGARSPDRSGSTTSGGRSVAVAARQP